MTERRWWLAVCLLTTVALLGFVAPGVISPATAARSSLAAPSGFGSLRPITVGLSGLQGMHVLGPLPAGTLLSGGLSFQAPDEQGQSALLNALYTPGGPEYHHFLTDGQFESRFAPNAQLQDALLSYLTSQGIQVTPTSVYLWTLVGTARDMGSAFGTSFVQATSGGHVGYAPETALSLPAEFRGFTSVSGGFQTVEPPKPTDLVRAPHFEGGDPAPGGTPSAALTVNMTSPYIINYQPKNFAVAFPPTNLNATWTLTLSGGTAPYKVSWHWYDGTVQNFVTSASSLANFHSYYQPGQADYCYSVVCGNVTVFVNDSASGSASYDVGLVPGASPTTLQRYYDVSTLLRLGDSGQGTKIGLDELCDPSYSSYASDLGTYSTDMGLPAPSLSLIGTGASSCIGGSSGWSGETLLDMEAAHASAPNATIVVDLADATIQEGDCTWNTLSNGVYLASNSWGGGTVSNSCWTTAASQGESYQASSGDCGAFTSGSRDEPADFPTGVGVGGTDVYPQPSGIFLREFAWNGTFQPSCGNNEGSTGGYSSVAAPWYQTGMTGFSGTKRGVPDVSAIGGTWFWMIYTGGVTLSAGTSLACPAYTAMLDLMWQYNSSTPKAQGMANYNLYTIAKGSNYGTAMHDVVVGNNIHGTSPPGFGYTATVGWDPVTGLGSADVGKLAMFLAQQNGNSAAFGALTAYLAANVTYGPASLSVDFGADVTGGSSPLTGYSYAWTFGDGGSATTSLAWTSHAYTTPGIYWATVTVTQGANSGSSNGVMVHVAGSSGGGGGNPSVTAPSASKSSIDVGQSVSFTTSASGGSGSYASYAWTASPSTGLGCTATTTTGTTTCSASAAGPYTVSVTVKDSAGHTSSPATSSSFPVYPDPTVAVPAPSASSITLGSSVTFTTSPGLVGSGSDTYSWAASPSSTAGCTGSTTTTFTCTPTAVGSYTATATNTDSNGGTGSNTSSAVAVVSGNAPSVTAPSPSRSSADVGQSVTFSTSASGGTGTGYVFTWTTSPAGLGCGGGTGSSLTCMPSAANAAYTVSVTVADSSGTSSAPASSTYTVDADPAAATPTAVPSSVDVGQSVTFTTSATVVGSGGDAFSWTASPSSGLNCGASSGTTLTCSPTSSGAYSVSATVADSNGGRGTSAALSYTVDADPAMSAPTPSPASVGVGGTVTFTAQVTSSGAGISSSSGYAWSASLSTFGCAASTTTTDACTPTAAGTFTVSVVATDANGLTASAASASYTVTSGSSGGITVQASATPSSGAAPLSVAFTASETGGSGTISYVWRFDDGETGTGASLSHTYANAGTYVAVVWVNDSQGHSGTGQATVTVGSAGTPPSNNPLGASVGGLPLWLLLVLLALVAVIVVAVVAARRRRAPGGGATGYPEGADPAAGYAPVPMGGAYAPPPGYVHEPGMAPAGAAPFPLYPPQAAPGAPSAPPPPPLSAASAPPASDPIPSPARASAKDRPVDEVAPNPFGGAGRR
ncbi:MAG: PKD domain-containing protein [Euryarchaeota archaeon]|nr:PKD domain-containing protein [Euryarchaeota archaeon]